MASLVFNESFSNVNKANTLSYDNGIVNIKGPKKEDSLNVEDITKIVVIHSKCPKPIIRYMTLLMEGFSIALLALAIAFFKNYRTASYIVGGIGIVAFIATSYITKRLYKNSPKAIECNIFKDKKASTLRMYNASDADFKRVSAFVKQIKRDNTKIKLEFNVRR